jgi:hypothetical protein
LSSVASASTTISPAALGGPGCDAGQGCGAQLCPKSDGHGGCPVGLTHTLLIGFKTTGRCRQSTTNGQMQAIDNQRTDAGNRQSTDRCRQSAINGQMQAIGNQRTDAGNRQSTDRCRQSTILRRYDEEEEEQEQTYDEGSRVRCLSILLKIDEKYTSRRSGRWQSRCTGQKMAEAMYGPEDGSGDVRTRQ